MVTLISHFFDEQMILPHFCRHWARMVDHAVMVDYHSQDDSAAIIREMCPHWEIRTSRNTMFDAHAVDVEIMGIESEFTGWKFTANSTEMILHHDLRGYVEQVERDYPDTMAVAMDSWMMCDKSPTVGTPLDDRYLFQQRYHGFRDNCHRARPFRFLHRGVHGQYTRVGRHATSLPYIYEPELVLLWWGFSPWPQSKERKMQIQKRIPQLDRERGHGVQHHVDEEELDRRWTETIGYSMDLREEPIYRQAYDRVCEAWELK